MAIGTIISGFGIDKLLYFLIRKFSKRRKK